MAFNREAFRAGFVLSKYHFDMAKATIQLPPDPSAKLDEWERIVRQWQDHPKLPHKAHALREIDFARQAIEDGNDEELKLELYYIALNAKNYESDILTVKSAEAAAKSKAAAPKGGKHRKDRPWAEAAAEWLVSKYGLELTLNEYVERLPESSNPQDVGGWLVYRDAGQLCLSGTNSKIKERRFKEKYLSTAKRDTI